MTTPQENLEEWRGIAGYEGLYQVSDFGRVRSLDRVVKHWCGGPSKRKGRILCPVMYGRPYPYLAVNLCKNGIQTTVTIHQLVAEEWIGPCPDGMQVCHGPSGRMDNSVSNLRYDTHRNNSLDKRRDGTHGGRPVKRSDGIEFINLHVAAEKSGCNFRNIWAVCNGRRKTAGGYGWEYI